MHTTSYAMSDGSEDASATPVLIAPAEVMAVVDALNLELGSMQETFPEPLPASYARTRTAPRLGGGMGAFRDTTGRSLGPTSRGRGY